MFSSEFEQALKATNIPVAHFGWETERYPLGDYIIYSEDGVNDFLAGDRHTERATEGTVDLFTRNYAANAAAPVEQALKSLTGVAWRLNSIQFEEDTRYTHYEWVVQEIG